MPVFDKISSFCIKWYKWFLFAILIPLPSYSLMMVNQLTNDVDGLWHGSISYAGNNELGEGRWLWRYLDKARLYLSPDPLTSFISLALLAVSVILVLHLLEVESRIVIISAILLFMINPTVGCFLSYRYMSPTFTMSVLLAILAAFCCIKIKNPIVSTAVFAVILAMSMGLYQTHLGCAVQLLVLDIVLGIYKGRYEIKEALIRALRYIGSICLGGILYIGIWNLELYRYGSEKSTYAGADQYTVSDMILNLPHSFVYAWTSGVGFILSKHGRALVVPRILYVIAAILFLAAVICAFCRLVKESVGRAVWFLVFILLMPAASGSVLFLAFDQGVQTQMTMPFVLLFIIMIYLTVLFTKDMEIKKPDMNKTAVAVCALLAVIFTYGAHIQLQYDEQAMYMGRQSMRTITEQIVDKLIAEDLYGYDHRYCFIGAPSNNRMYIRNDVIEKANGYGKYGEILWDAKQSRLAWTTFFANEMGIDIRIVDEDVYQEFLDSEEVQQMPDFPAEGSVREFDDCVVIKVAQW